ncbi:MAG: DUF4810 domain-containing protein [Ketobacteraceae bacterium]|nr:DUF4810 domain-containing protein [Ketobacteraceae bacterium]
MRSLLLISVAVIGLSGCSHGLYDWGGYNSHLYSYYENPDAAEAFREALERHIGYLESAGRIPPPGLYAELGTLYLEKGDTAQAIIFYDKERQAWPESRPLMSSLIASLSKTTAQE